MAEFGILMLELFVEILVGLPVKSLKRFQSVRKSWHDLIASDYFISKHLLHSKSNSKKARLLVKHEPSEKPCVSLNCRLSVLSMSPQRFQLMNGLSIPVFKGNGYLYLKACNANGIICICYKYWDETESFYNGSKPCQDVLLWNPSIREYMLLPNQYVKDAHDPDVCFGFQRCQHFNVAYKFHALGFGYDATNDDYKVIRVVAFHVQQLRGGADRPQLVELYSLKSNSWRKLDISMPVSVIISRPCTEVYLNEAYHWLAKVYADQENEVILSFNMVDEIFSTIELPDVDGLQSLHKNFSVLNNSIIMIACNENQRWKNFHVWSMTKYGVKESWTKLYDFGPFNIVNKPLGFGTNGELLMYSKHGILMRWDEDELKFKHFGISGISSTSGALAYVESLVSIRRIMGA